MYLSQDSSVNEIEADVNGECSIGLSPNNTEIFRDEGIRSVAWLKQRNLNDPRNEHRIKCVLGYLWGKFKNGSPNVVREISSKELRSELVFGESETTRALQDCLLLRVGGHHFHHWCERPRVSLLRTPFASPPEPPQSLADRHGGTSRA